MGATLSPLVVADTLHPTLAGNDPETLLDLAIQLFTRLLFQAESCDIQQRPPCFDPEADVYPSSPIAVIGRPSGSGGEPEVAQLLGGPQYPPQLSGDFLVDLHRCGYPIDPIGQCVVGQRLPRETRVGIKLFALRNQPEVVSHSPCHLRSRA